MLRLVLLCFVAVVAAGIGIVYTGIRLSLGDEDTQGFVQGLTVPITVAVDQFGVPDINAESRLDGFRALGYVMTRDRLFQMDLLRRQSAGRLSEIFGEAMVSMDERQRILGFEGVAMEIARRLPINQREALEAYVDGVNSAIDSMTVMPFEFLLLGYRPDRWRIEDTLLVILGMFQIQSNSESEERMLSVMERALPLEAYRFFTPTTDPYTRAVLGEEEFSSDDNRVPIESLVSLLQLQLPPPSEKQAGFVQSHHMQSGSNAWGVAGVKTRDGRAILANDMHISISVPNIWYRCKLSFEGNDTGGVCLPGTPLIIAGTSRNLAWGMTALVADVQDLVKVEINPEDHNEYRTPDGWKRFEIRRESIRVKNASTREIDIRTTIWGPVATEPLLEQPVAIRWTALDPEAVDVGLLDIYEAKTLEEGVKVINKTGGPPLNAILADNTGRIAWTTMGRLPIRLGFDGAASRPWSDGSARWIGYIPSEKLPRNVDPPDGFLVNANNRSVGKNYPFTIGHAFGNGYRAYRITERLRAMEHVNEENMFQLQLDTKAGVYGFYRDVALSVLKPKILATRSDLRELRDHLNSWDGQAEIDSLGLGVLVQFRMELAKAVFEPLLISCRVLDDKFIYSWTHLDLPLRALLTTKDQKLIPEGERYPNWDAFLLAKLEQSTRVLVQKHSAISLHDLAWGKINIAGYVHPLSQGIPGIARFLDLPRDSLPGCGFCVRVDSETTGATERLVISPAHWEDGILHIPGGQSGHPLSSNYRSQYPYWVNGLPLRFMSEASPHSLRLMPAKSLGTN